MELKTFFAQNVDGNVIPGAYVYLYYPGTTDLATGLEDEDGNPLDNPFNADSDGQIKVAAPNGKYDIRVSSSGRDHRIGVQFFDASEGGTLPVDSATGTEDLKGALNRRVIHVTDMTSLQNLEMSQLEEGQAFEIMRTGRAGMFAWEIGNHQAHITSDPSSIEWIPHTSDPNGTTGVFRRRYQLKDGISPKWAGALGDGIAVDYDPIRRTISFAASIGAYVRPDNGDIYDLGGNTVDEGMDVRIKCDGEFTFRNGGCIFRKGFGDIELDGVCFEDCKANIGGYLGTPSGDPEDPQLDFASVRTGKVRSRNSTITYQYIKNPDIGVTSVHFDAEVAGNRGVNLSAIYGGRLGRFVLSGKLSMGLETIGNSSQPIFNTYVCEFGPIISHKEPGYADEPGNHGIYLHGNKKSVFSWLDSSGWMGTNNADCKFRDNHGCTINKFTLGRLRLTSDANTATLTSQEHNELNNIQCNEITTTYNGSGSHQNNKIHNISAAFNFGNIDDYVAYILSGSIDILNLGPIDIRNAGLRFRSAEITSNMAFDGSGAAIQGYVDAQGSCIVGDIYSVGGNWLMTNTDVTGSATHNAPNGTHYLHLNNFTVNGDLTTNSYDQRNIVTDWKLVSSGGAEPRTSYTPSSKKYRFVSYGDVTYIDENTRSAV
ncbi:hypothetical protein [Halomonas maura]|uniref:hypothetical protein n=1 Tax=Halomonas maura TaxID=117606 RepID=UPI0025B50D59|nr:hypothetical protein [Halomonas maura]MDN3554921.1 hypothetical protein [Halomonas maura]